jgi:phosphohistidine phosphatase
MQLYLLRHANADTPASTDFDRALSELGVCQARNVGRFCRDHGLVPEIVLTSPLLRARQTAEHFTQALGVPPAEVASFLASGMSPQMALAELRAYQDFETVLIVGHEPDFSMLITELLGLPSPEHVSVKKASLTRLSVRRLRVGGARMEFSIPCRLMAPPTPPQV